MSTPVLNDTLFDYFAQASEVFERAGSVVADVFLAVADTTIRLQFASPALARLLVPALAHLVSAPAPADFTVCLWDDASAQHPMPPPPWPGYGKRGEIAGLTSPRVRAAFCHPGCTLSMLDQERRQALYWTAAAAEQPGWERSAPLRTLLAWMLERPGRHLVHGAAIGRPSGGVVLAGKGGSGKSTSALACLAADSLHYAGDDYTLLTAMGPTIHSLYNSARVCHDSLFRVSHLDDARQTAGPPDEEKTQFLLFPQHRHRLLAEFPLRAVLLPRLGAPRTGLAPATAGDGVNALAVTSMAQLPWAGRALVDTVQAVLEQIPCYFLDLGPDTDQVPELVARLLR